MAATPVTAKNVFLVFTPDVPDSQRTQRTPEHMEQNMPLIECGYIIAGGGLLPTGSLTTDADARAKITGSVIFVRAESAEEVWATLKKDAFYTHGDVWDHEKITVTPVSLGWPKLE